MDSHCSHSQDSPLLLRPPSVAIIGRSKTDDDATQDPVPSRRQVHPPFLPTCSSPLETRPSARERRRRWASAWVSPRIQLAFSGLSSYQRRALFQTWPNIYSTGPGGAFASSVYVRLSTKSSKAKELLSKVLVRPSFGLSGERRCRLRPERSWLHGVARSSHARHSRSSRAKCGQRRAAHPRSHPGRRPCASASSAERLHGLPFRRPRFVLASPGEA